jgi:hypothetical protein
MDGRAVEVLEDEFGDPLFSYCEVEVRRKAAFVAESELAKRGTAFKDEAKIEETGDVKVVQRMVLSDVDERAVAEQALALVVAQEQAFGYHAFALGTSSASMRL